MNFQNLLALIQSISIVQLLVVLPALGLTQISSFQTETHPAHIVTQLQAHTNTPQITRGIATQDRSLPSQLQSYEERPHISKISPIDHDLGRIWKKLLKAQFAFVTELITLYPKKELYFLARDSEMLYDIAYLMTEGTPMQKRLHLVNVSSENKGSPLLKKYLESHGLTEQSLQSGRQVVFIDTGFFGTIVNKIGDLFSPLVRSQMQTHLIVSLNPDFPSSYVFMNEIKANILSYKTKDLEKELEEYEHIERATGRAKEFRLINGEVLAIGNRKGDMDGKIDREKAQKYQESLKAFWQKNEVKHHYLLQNSIWQELLHILVAEVNDEQILQDLEDFLDHTSFVGLGQIEEEVQFRRVILRDALEYLLKNEIKRFSLKVYKLGRVDVSLDMELGLPFESDIVQNKCAISF